MAELQIELPQLYKRIVASLPDVSKKFRAVQRHAKGMEEIEHDMMRVAELHFIFEEEKLGNIEAEMNYANPASRKALKAFQDALNEERDDLVKKYLFNDFNSLYDLSNHWGQTNDSMKSDTAKFISGYVQDKISEYFYKKHPGRLDHHQSYIEFCHQFADALANIYNFDENALQCLKIEFAKKYSIGDAPPQIPNFLASIGNAAQIAHYTERNGFVALLPLFESAELQELLPESLADRKVPWIWDLNFHERGLYCLTLLDKFGVELPPVYKELLAERQKRGQATPTGREKLIQIESAAQVFTQGRSASEPLPDFLTRAGKRYVAGLVASVLAETKPKTLPDDPVTTSVIPAAAAESPPAQLAHATPVSPEVPHPSFAEKIPIPRAGDWAAAEPKPAPTWEESREQEPDPTRNTGK